MHQFYSNGTEQEAALEKAMHAAHAAVIGGHGSGSLNASNNANAHAAAKLLQEHLEAAAAAQRQQENNQMQAQFAAAHAAIQMERSRSAVPVSEAPGLSRSSSAHVGHGVAKAPPAGLAPPPMLQSHPSFGFEHAAHAVNQIKNASISVPASNASAQGGSPSNKASPATAATKSIIDSERLIKGGLQIVIENLDTIAGSNKKIIAENASLKDELSATKAQFVQVKAHSEELSAQLAEKDKEYRTLAWREHGLRNSMKDTNGGASFDHGYAMLADALAKLETENTQLIKKNEELTRKNADLLIESHANREKECSTPATTVASHYSSNASEKGSVSTKEKRTKSEISTTTGSHTVSSDRTESNDKAESVTSPSSNSATVPPGFDKVYGAEIIFAGCSDGSDNEDDGTSSVLEKTSTTASSIPPPPTVPCPPSPPEYSVPPPPIAAEAAVSPLISERSQSSDAASQKSTSSSTRSNTVTPRGGASAKSSSAWCRLTPSSSAPSTTAFTKTKSNSADHADEAGWFSVRSKADSKLAEKFSCDKTVLTAEDGSKVTLDARDMKAREVLVKLCSKHDVDTRTIQWFLRAEHVQFWAALGDKTGELDRRAESGSGTGVRNPSAWLTKYFNTLRNHQN